MDIPFQLTTKMSGKDVTPKGGIENLKKKKNLVRRKGNTIYRKQLKNNFAWGGEMFFEHPR